MLMKKLLKIIIVIAVLAGVALGVKSFFFNGDATSQAGALISTKVVTDTIKTTISATGSLEPVDQVEVVRRFLAISPRLTLISIPRSRKAKSLPNLTNPSCSRL